MGTWMMADAPRFSNCSILEMTSPFLTMTRTARMAESSSELTVGLSKPGVISSARLNNSRGTLYSSNE